LTSTRRADRLTVTGIKLQPRIGVTPGERRMPQPCQADITLFGDFEAAASTDSLDSAIDYSKVVNVVLETAHGKEYNLVETLAYQLARRVLQSFPAARVGVRVRKRPAALMEKIEFVEVEIEQP
jgi:7,8-dihydroneopterin aldolase/epimerase/oxygenase